MFFQIHMLQSVPPGNLNRDEAGQPKKCLFGGVTRGRISSQCLKRNMRSAPVFEAAFGESTATRTRLFPKLVSDAFRNLYGADEEESEGLKVALKKLFGGKEKASGEEEDGESSSTPKEQDEANKTSQVVFFPMLFVEKVAGLLNELRKNEPQAWQIFVGKKKAKKTDKDEVQKITRPYLEEARKAKESMAVDVALFGRMTTSDLIANVDASCQVAHAISTHEALIESDYFTAVDELDRSGAGFVSDSEAMTFFNAAVYYKYVNVDARAFLTTIGDQGAAHAKKVPAVLLQAAALSSPTGKQNSFAAHSVPELILVEASHVRQPISYANAFLQPIRGDDLMRESVGALSEYCGSVARAFAPQDTQRFLLTAGRAAGVPFNLDAVKVETLAELVARVENAWTPDLQPV